MLHVSRIPPDIIAARRGQVAHLRARGLSCREIATKLADAGCNNPTSGAPWTHDTVHRDIQALTVDWQRTTGEDFKAQVAVHLAELREVRKVAWETMELGIVLKSLKQEAELLRLHAPVEVDVEEPIRTMARQLGLDEDEAVKNALAILKEWKHNGR